MLRQIVLSVIFVGLVLSSLFGRYAFANEDEAIKMEEEAIQMMPTNPDAGLEKLKQATLLNPKNGIRRLNYASIVFRKGAYLHQSGNMQAALPVVDEAELELKTAAELLKKDPKDSLALSQAYYLIGEIYLYVRSDRKQAKEYYEKALSAHSENQGARMALKSLNSQVNLPLAGSVRPEGKIPAGQQSKAVDSGILNVSKKTSAEKK